MFLGHSITFSFSRSGLLPLESTLQRGCYSLGLQVQERRYVQGPSPIVRTPHSSVLSDPNLYKSTSVRVPGWSVNCSRWRAARRLVSSSLTRLTRSAAHALTTELAGTTKYSGRCWS